MKNKLVYSTERSHCLQCGKILKKCRCDTSPDNIPAADGIVRIQRQTKGKKRAGVTLITGLPLNQEELKRYAKKLKKRCGSGGTVKDGIIEIQGDHRQTLLDELQCHSQWRVKLAGS